ncbi:MAG: insulinase family protein [Clostridia bacterium]|nr:insulinase family protein [Clostridia bacterium]
MGVTFNKEIGPGIRLFGVKQDSLKSNRITVSVLVPLKKETASLYAIIPQILQSCGSEYPNYTALKRKLAELYGASLYGYSSKWGDMQALTISVKAIDNRFAPGGEDVLQSCGKLILSLFLRPLLDENGNFTEETLAERKRLACEKIISQINNKRLFALRDAMAKMCPGDGYGVDPSGTVEGINALTGEDIANGWRTLLKTGDITVSAVGSGNFTSFLESAGEQLLKLERDFTPAENPAIYAPEAFGEYTVRMPVTQAKLVLGFKTGTNLQTGGYTACELFSYLFGRTPHSLLFTNVREKLSLCYYCVSHYAQVKGVMLVDSGLEEKNAKQAEEEILSQLERIKQGDFSDEEFASAVQSLVNERLSSCDSGDALEGYYYPLLRGGLPLKTPQESAEEIRKYTRQDVINIASDITLSYRYLLAGEVKDNG